MSPSLGAELYRLVAELFPLCRSITGNGTRQTLQRIQAEIPLTIHEVPSGTRVLDWTVPPEWNITDAYVKDPYGRRVVDFRQTNLAVVQYSQPVHARMTLASLRPHLHSLPEHPDRIPYRTSYYQPTWGFCLPHRVLTSLPEGEYEVAIDSCLAPGAMSFGEYRIQGQSDDEVLVSTHCCHPSLANDNLSGIAVATALARHLSRSAPRLSYRFVFVPGTIGSITWLALREEVLSRVRHGVVLSCLGDRGSFTYKRSRHGAAPIDRAAAHVLGQMGLAHRVREFVPYGYDERQYCSPGYDLPVGCITRTPHGEYSEYHSSADDLSLISGASMAEAVELLLRLFSIVEANGHFVNLQPHGEPQLGRRGLYHDVGGAAIPGFELALLWILNQSDGAHDLLSIADRAALPFETALAAANRLTDAGLLTRLPGRGGKVPL